MALPSKFSGEDGCDPFGLSANDDSVRFSLFANSCKYVTHILQLHVPNSG